MSDTEPSTVKSGNGRWNWFKYKLFYGGTFKGMITFTIVYLFVIVLFLSTFSQPIVDLFGAPLLPFEFSSSTEDLMAFSARVAMLYHAIAVPFLAICTYFVLEYCDVREKFKSRIKWPLFFGSMLTSICGILYSYFFPKGWILHGLYLLGLSLCFYAGILLLIAIFPTKSFPKNWNKQENKINIIFEQLALVTIAICILLTTVLGASIGAFFGNDDLTAFLAEYFLREPEVLPYPYDVAEIFVDGVKAHLHAMLAQIDVIILLVVFRYTMGNNPKGRLHLLAMIMAIPGTFILSLGSWLVTFKSVVPLITFGILEEWPFDMHYLIYVGSAIVVTVGVILALIGWSKLSKDTLGDAYKSAGWGTRIKALFKDPVKFTLYFLFIWVNFVMTFSGIFLALSLHDTSVLAKVLPFVSFRSGPLAVETTVARGHWHILATLSAVTLFLLFVDILRVEGKSRKVMGWLMLAGSILAFGFGMIYMYFPHLDQNWANNLTLYASVQEFWEVNAFWEPLLLDLGITLIALALVIFCFYELIQIIKGKRDVNVFPE